MLAFFTLGTAQENIIRNHEFDMGRRYWMIRDEDPAELEFDFPSDSTMSGPNYCRIHVIQGGDDEKDAYAMQSVSIDPGTFYTISFMLMADTPCTIRAAFQESGELERQFWTSPPLELAPEPKEFGPYTFNSRSLDVSNRLVFWLGGKDDMTFGIDAVTVTVEEDPNFVPTVEKFSYRSHTHNGTILPYRLCKPDFYDPQQNYPLVLCLHGAGERGTDNESHIQVHRMATMWADSINQEKHPCFVVAPQCPDGNRWVDSDWSTGKFRIDDVPESNENKCVMDMLDSLITEFPVDTNRIYVTGLSMGGYGTWDLITRHPDTFAAAVPMSGGGDSTAAARIKHMPLWIFHGENDNTVPAEGSRQMVRAMQERGREAVFTHCHFGNCEGMRLEEVGAAVDAGARLLYTEWENKNHVMWAESYDYPHLLPWIFAQNRPANYDHVAEKEAPQQFQLLQNYPNPFNPVTTIGYTLEKPSHVSIQIFDVLGRHVRTLLQKQQASGQHHILFDASDLPSGTYMYQITTNRSSRYRSMTLKK